MKSLIAVPFLIGSLPLLGSVAIGYNYLKSKRESNKYLFWGGISGFAFAGWMASNMIMTRYTESLDFERMSGLPISSFTGKPMTDSEVLTMYQFYIEVPEGWELDEPNLSVEEYKQRLIEKGNPTVKQNAESFSAEAETWTEDNVCLKCNSPFDGCSCERCPQCDEFWNDGWLNCDECFSCDDCCRESCPHLWEAESFSAEGDSGEVYALKKALKAYKGTLEDCLDGRYGTDDAESVMDDLEDSHHIVRFLGAESKFVKPYDRRGKIDFRRDNKGRYRRKLSIPLKKK